MRCRTVEDAKEYHNDSPLIDAVVGAMTGVVGGMVIAWEVRDPDAVYMIVAFAALTGAIVGYFFGLRHGREIVFVEVDGHPDRGIYIRALDSALQAHWPQRWAELQRCRSAQ